MISLTSWACWGSMKAFLPVNAEMRSCLARITTVISTRSMVYLLTLSMLSWCKNWCEMITKLGCKAPANPFTPVSYQYLKCTSSSGRLPLTCRKDALLLLGRSVGQGTAPRLSRKFLTSGSTAPDAQGTASVHHACLVRATVYSEKFEFSQAASRRQRLPDAGQPSVCSLEWS